MKQKFQTFIGAAAGTSPMGTLACGKVQNMEHATVSERKKVYGGTAINVYRDTMSLPGGGTEYWDYVEHRWGAAAVLPVLEDGRLLLIRQYRPAAEDFVWELPAGARNGGTEDPYDCAVRELREETGYAAKEILHLFSFRTSVAYCNERIEVYLAKDAYPVGKQILDAAEHIELKAWKKEEVLAMIRDGRLQDGKTIAAVMAWDAYHDMQGSADESALP